MDTTSIMSIVNRTADSTLLHNNANKASERIPVMRDMVAGEVSKHLALTEILPKEVAEAHTKGELHYHDLDYAPLFPMFNCLLIHLEGMLSKGFKMGNADIETPKSISTATAITSQIIAQVASHIYGGNTINNIDIVLAPYVKASYKKHLANGKLWCVDDATAVAYASTMTDKETYDAFQALEYEINTLHTANGQTPFTTFGFGTGTSWEARLVQRSILEVRRAGLGKDSRTAIFPKLIFILKEGVNLNKGDINYDIKQLALKCSSERIYPDIISAKVLQENIGGVWTPMGCRSFLHEHPDGPDGRNNLGVVSINLPRIAIESGGSLEIFWELLSERLGTCYQALTTRIDALCGVKAEVAPILYMEGACGHRLKADEEVMQLFDKGRASISLGYIGVHEMCMAMYPNGLHTFDDPDKRGFGEAVVQELHDTCAEWKERSGFAFSLYSTPSESLCDRFCRLDAEEFGVIEDVTDKGYYTNSFHLDVNKEVNPYDKIDFEMDYPKSATGGFICYGEFPNMKHNLQALEDFWDYCYDRVPYYGANTPIDECFECGFAGEFNCTSKGFVCPNCGNSNSRTISVIRRVCGYLGAPDSRQFIEGKQKEMEARVKHYGCFE